MSKDEEDAIMDELDMLLEDLTAMYQSRRDVDATKKQVRLLLSKVECRSYEQGYADGNKYDPQSFQH